jgi:hypothetical protein
MKCEIRSHKNRSKRPWIPRPDVLIPPHRAIKGKKTYDRKRAKDIWRLLYEYY